MRWRLLERTFLILGLACLAVWLGSLAMTRVMQYQDSIKFDHEREVPQSPRSTEVPRSPRPQPLETDEVIGRLTIPRLQLSAMVREGDGDGTLRVSLGHVPGTALPGQPGNVAIAGHRDTLFRPLRLVRQDDLIELESTSGSYSYRVQSVEVVSPTDVAVLAAGSGPELTLVTCYPFYYVGAAPKRFIVKARQVDAVVVAKDSSGSGNGAESGTTDVAGVDQPVGDMKDAWKALLPGFVRRWHILP